MEEVDLKEGEVKWEDYICIGVRVDIAKSLLHKKRFIIGNLEPMWISFSHEKLPDFCFDCGVMGHGYKD